MQATDLYLDHLHWIFMLLHTVISSLVYTSAGVFVFPNVPMITQLWDAQWLQQSQVFKTR